MLTGLVFTVLNVDCQSGAATPAPKLRAKVAKEENPKTRPMIEEGKK